MELASIPGLMDHVTMVHGSRIKFMVKAPTIGSMAGFTLEIGSII